MSNFTNNFKFAPYEKVLVRDSEKGVWVATTYSHFVKKNKMFKHKCTDGLVHMYCIPFEKNEHLLGTNKDFYMPNKGDLVLVSNNGIDYCVAIYEGYKYSKNVYIAYDRTFIDSPMFKAFQFCKSFNGRIY